MRRRLEKLADDRHNATMSVLNKSLDTIGNMEIRLRSYLASNSVPHKARYPVVKFPVHDHDKHTPESTPSSYLFSTSKSSSSNGCRGCNMFMCRSEHNNPKGIYPNTSQFAVINMKPSLDDSLVAPLAYHPLPQTEKRRSMLRERVEARLNVGVGQFGKPPLPGFTGVYINKPTLATLTQIANRKKEPVDVSCCGHSCNFDSRRLCNSASTQATNCQYVAPAAVEYPAPIHQFEAIDPTVYAQHSFHMHERVSNKSYKDPSFMFSFCKSRSSEKKQVANTRRTVKSKLNKSSASRDKSIGSSSQTRKLENTRGSCTKYPQPSRQKSSSRNNGSILGVSFGDR